MSDLLVIENDICDRSTLENYATCPARARFIESGACRAVGMAAHIGNAVHDAISKTIASFVAAQGFLKPSDIQEMLVVNLRGSRPDVQPQAIKAFSRSVWAFSQYLGNLHFENILHFDGGKDAQSGQLAYDFEDLEVTVTSEVDLLHATKSRELLEELDWKSGWKNWTEELVADSFQFQMHPFLILKNYPDVEAVRISIWNTRLGKKTYPVEFTRRDLPAIEARIRSAIQHRHDHKDSIPELCEAWPAPEKCRICDAAEMCPSASRDVSEIAKDPAAFLGQMVAVSAKLEAMEKTANAWVDSHGEIIAGSVCYGTEKPASRKPTKSLYTRKASNGDEE